VIIDLSHDEREKTKFAVQQTLMFGNSSEAETLKWAGWKLMTGEDDYTSDEIVCMARALNSYANTRTEPQKSYLESISKKIMSLQ
jgi:hypothetical protein